MLVACKGREGGQSLVKVGPPRGTQALRAIDQHGAARHALQADGAVDDGAQLQQRAVLVLRVVNHACHAPEEQSDSAAQWLQPVVPPLPRLLACLPPPLAAAAAAGAGC